MAAFHVSQLELASKTPVLYYSMSKKDEPLIHANMILSVAENVCLPIKGRLQSIRALASSTFDSNDDLSILQYFCHELLENPAYLTTPKDMPPCGMTMEEYNSNVFSKRPKENAKRALGERYESLCSNCLYNFCHLYIKTCLEHNWINVKGDKGFEVIPLETLTLTFQGALSFVFCCGCTFNLSAKTTPTHRVQRAMIEESRYISRFIETYRRVSTSVCLLSDKSVANAKALELIPTGNLVEGIVDYLELPRDRNLSWATAFMVCIDSINVRPESSKHGLSRKSIAYFTLLRSTTECIQIYFVVDRRTGKVFLRTSSNFNKEVILID